MTLNDLARYYDRRATQVDCLVVARSQRRNKSVHLQWMLWWELFQWAEALYEADELADKIGLVRFVPPYRGEALVRLSRGLS